MKAKTERRIRMLGALLFTAYMVVLIYLLFFADEYGRSAVGEYRVNLVPFLEIRRFLDNREVIGTWPVMLNVFGNILLFIPFGAILPVLHPRFRRWWVTILSAAIISIIVELSQLLLRRGSCDIDDVMLNTLGAAVGYMLFALCNHLRKKLSGNRRAYGKGTVSDGKTAENEDVQI